METSGGWTLGRTIGRGATATVSLATTSNSGEIFAVKSSHISRSALLQREQNILSSLSSPHIISCLGFNISDESYHLFLELAGGGALSDFAGRLGASKIRSFTHQILQALCYLHSNGVAHCDVKGRNVLVCSDDCVKLADFGCARSIGGGNELVMGTPAFMAPEVARGEEQGTAGDLWSLGCTVVEMATGNSPWPESSDPVSVIHRIALSSDVPAMPEWVSDEGKDFVSKCLIRDPKQRWTAEQLLRHPYMAEAEETEESLAQLCSSSKQWKWVSPKSTLESGLWDSEAEEDAEEQDEENKNKSEERIRNLASPPANWTWDNSWIAVRGRPDEFNEIAMSEFEFSRTINSDELSGSGGMFFVERNGCENETPISDAIFGEEEDDVMRSCNGFIGFKKEFQSSYFIFFIGVLICDYLNCLSLFSGDFCVRSLDIYVF